MSIYVVTGVLPGGVIPQHVRVTCMCNVFMCSQEYFLEGAFRNVHARLRTHAESIAFFGGGACEGKTVDTYFNNLMKHLYTVIDVRCASTVS